MLFHEYALDPRLLNNWKDFRYFADAFGWSKGRLISRYPRRWKALVYDQLGECTPVEKLKIVERLKNIDEKIIQRSESEWNPAEPDWLTNAEIEHVARPFYRLIASENPRANDDVLLGEELDEDDEAWRLKTVIEVNRDATKMADAVSTLLRTSRSICLIDPHFAPEMPRYIRTLATFVSAALEGRTVALDRLEYHLLNKSTDEFFETQCTDTVCPILPPGLEVLFVRWESKPGGEALHDRFILTERGGVRFTVGLDDGNKNTFTGIEILSEASYHKYVGDYLSGTPVFDLKGTLTVKAIPV